MGVFTEFFKNANGREIKVSLDPTTGLVRQVPYADEFGQGSSASVNEETALKIASLNQGINIICDSIASMSVYLFKEEDGFQQIMEEDSRNRVLSGMANEVLTSFNLKKVMIKDLILYGNAYAKIVREGDKISLVYLPVNIVTAKYDNSGYYFEVASYSTDVGGEKVEAEVVDYYDMLCLIRNPKQNSLKGQGLLDYASSTLDLATQETTYMVNLFKNGLSAKAVLSSKTPFKKEIKEQLKSDLRDFYSGSSNAGKMLVLEGDINVLPLSLSPNDLKLIEQKNFTVTEIARFLNIPKHMLSLDRGQGTYSNITQERLQLLTNTLTPYVVAFEEALSQKLLEEEEVAQGYYFQFDTAEMLKLTPQDNSAYMINLYKENIVTLEEVRATLNLGGDMEVINELKAYKQAKINTVTSTESKSEEDNTNEAKKETPKKVEESTEDLNK